MSDRTRKCCAVPTITVLLALFMGTTCLHSEDWPMRGRDWTRNAVSPEKHAPIDWDVGLSGMESRNILWSARLGSLSCGDPVVADGLVWVGTNSRDGDASVLMCFRERDGDFLYEYVSPRLDDPIRYDWSSTSLASSPLIEGDRLWFCTNRCEVVCLNIGPLHEGTGEPEVAWKVDMRARLGVVPSGVMIGCNASHCSIAAQGDLIYVNTTNARYGKSVPAPDAPSLVCFNQHTGEVVWTDNSPGNDILDVQFGSPLVAEIDGRAQVIMGQGDGWLRSFDCRTGELIWKFDINDKDPRQEWPYNYFVATPVFHNNRIYIARGRHFEICGGAGRLCCIDATKQGDVSSEIDDGAGMRRPNPNSGLVWEFTSRGDRFEDAMHGTLSSVVIDDSLVIAPDTTGLVHCLNAETGEQLWTHDTLAAITASPLIVDGKMYIGSDEGTLHILEVSPTKSVVAAVDMGVPIDASPVFANGVLYVMTRNMLYAIRAPERGGG